MMLQIRMTLQLSEDTLNSVENPESFFSIVGALSSQSFHYFKLVLSSEEYFLSAVRADADPFYIRDTPYWNAPDSFEFTCKSTGTSRHKDVREIYLLEKPIHRINSGDIVKRPDFIAMSYKVGNVVKEVQACHKNSLQRDR